MKPKNENKIIMKQWVQVFILIAVIFAMSFAIWAIVSSLNKGESKKEELYNYSYNSNLDYKVYLKPNSFFNSQYLGMNKQYITSIIDHIEVTAKYDFQASKDIDYTYSYNIIATAKGVYSESDSKSAEIWSKSYDIVPVETKSATGNKFNILKTFNVDYNQYNQIMSDFRTQFGLSVESRVDIVFSVNVSGGINGDNSLQESYEMTLPIPLLSSTIELKPDYVNSGHDVVYKSEKTNQEINIPLLIFGITLLILSLILFKKFGGKLLATTKKSEYVLNLNKLLKTYGDIIAEADNMPELDKYDVVNIKIFNDLVDIEEELHSPILAVEVREDLETWFIILTDKTAYRYILKYEDLDHFRTNYKK